MSAVAPTVSVSPEPRLSAGRVILIVLGGLGSLVAAALVAAGGFLLWLDQTQRDASGYVTSSMERFSTPTFALTSDGLTIAHVDSAGPDWAVDVFDKVRIRGLSASEKPLFIGIAREQDVARYLAGVAHDEVTDVHHGPFAVSYETTAGNGRPAPPGAQSFWAASTARTGTETLVWKVGRGTWSVVVMNADASSGVAASLEAGARLPFLLWLAVIGLGGGLVLLLGSGGLVHLARARWTKIRKE